MLRRTQAVRRAVGSELSRQQQQAAVALPQSRRLASTGTARGLPSDGVGTKMGRHHAPQDHARRGIIWRKVLAAAVSALDQHTNVLVAGNKQLMMAAAKPSNAAFVGTGDWALEMAWCKTPHYVQQLRQREGGRRVLAGGSVQSGLALAVMVASQVSMKFPAAIYEDVRRLAVPTSVISLDDARPLAFAKTSSYPFPLDGSWEFREWTIPLFFLQLVQTHWSAKLGRAQVRPHVAETTKRIIESRMKSFFDSQMDEEPQRRGPRLRPKEKRPKP